MKTKEVVFAGWRNYVSLLFLLLLLSACTIAGSGPFGSMRKSQEIKNLFKSATILPDHTYYVQGPLSSPEAIMALKNTYQLRSTLWSKVEWTEKEMADVVFWMEDVKVVFCTTDGGNLFAPDGQKIGIWYSKRIDSVIKEPEPGVIEVYPLRFRPGSPCDRENLLDKL